MSRPLRWIDIAACLPFLASAAWLGHLEQTPPPRADLMLDGGIPATLYLPGTVVGRAAFEDAPPRGERPPAVVLMHGIISDRLIMSALARRLAIAGYAVLTIDASGHGQNRNPFRRSRARPESLQADVAAAVDYLRADPRVDGERIVVMGHSMGAGASLDFATRDSGLDAAVLISGGSALQGPQRPANALFVYAAGDPSRVKERSRQLAARIAGVPDLALGRTYGDPLRGTGVRVVEIPGVDHATIVWSRAAALEIVRWLDGVFGRPATTAVASDPRLLASLLASISLLALLPALGAIVGRLLPGAEEPAAGRPLPALVLIAAALFAVMPLLAVDTPAAALPLAIGDVVVSLLSLAGIAILAIQALRGESLLPSPRQLGAAAGPAALAIVALYVLLLPVGAVVHRMTLVPERALAFVFASAALLPFALALQGLLRRGPPRRASLIALVGRVLVLAVLVTGVMLGLLSFVVVLMLPALILVYALFELLAASIYATSRNVTAIALIDAAWLGLFVAATMPLTL